MKHFIMIDVTCCWNKLKWWITQQDSNLTFAWIYALTDRERCQEKEYRSFPKIKKQGRTRLGGESTQWGSRENLESRGRWLFFLLDCNKNDLELPQWITQNLRR